MISLELIMNTPGHKIDETLSKGRTNQIIK
jgi:hypothetical protein